MRLLKYNILLVALALFASSVVAQEANNSNQSTANTTDLFPKSGDYGFSISATPVVNFVGNMFNGTQNQNIGQIGGDPLLSDNYSGSPYPTISIMGKYFYSDKIALRANIGVIFGNSRNSAYVADDLLRAQDPFSEADVIDIEKLTYSGASFAFGGEYRVGSGRVQGVLGVDLMYAYSVERARYTYGNAITELNQRPTIGTNMPSYTAISSVMPNARLLNEYLGGHTVGLVGHVGVELFVAPRISLGANINLSALYNWTAMEYNEREGYNVLTGAVETYTNLTSPKSHMFIFGTQNVGANFTVNFYLRDK